MFKDESFPIIIATSSFTSGDNSDTSLKVRLDVDISAESFGKVTGLLGDIIPVIAGTEDNGFILIQMKHKTPVYNLQFAVNSHGLRVTDGRVDVQGITFDEQIAVVRRIDKVDKNIKRELYVLQLHTKLPRPVLNMAFESFKNRIWCRFVETQTELPLDDNDKDQGTQP